MMTMKIVMTNTCSVLAETRDNECSSDDVTASSSNDDDDESNSDIGPGSAKKVCRTKYGCSATLLML